MTGHSDSAASQTALLGLNDRSREIFRRIVDSYLTTGEPVGSRNLSKIIPIALSPASIRNVMADLEGAGLIYAPHVSAGRLPTEKGLRFFVDSMLEIGDLTSEERRDIEAQVRASGQNKSTETLLAEASTLISGLTRSAGVVLTSKISSPLKHIEFVRIEKLRALAVLVSEDGSIENRIVELPPGLPASALIEASNYLSHHIKGKTIADLKLELEHARQQAEQELDSLTANLVAAGLASWAGEQQDRHLIVRGQAHLLEDLKAMEDLSRIKLLFDDLETQKDVIDLLSRAERSEGVRIYIGSENKLFSLSGSSMIATPFRDQNQKIVGVLGVIGPTRLNYARVVPMVDYTARVISQLLNEGR
jgi:heat-inducible transcriptional repressor